MARQALEHTLAHTGATDLDVAMFHRNGGTLTHNNLHACTYTHIHNNYTPYLFLFFIQKFAVVDICFDNSGRNIILNLFLSLVLFVCMSFSQVRIQTLILISHWRRREVSPSHLLRARTTFVCVDASIGASSAPLTESVCSQNQRTMVEKVILSSLKV